MSTAPHGDGGAGLPQPSVEARAHGEQVVAHVAALIAEAGGWLSFADYMGAVLYAPGLGYYAAGARKFGAAGDFVTAPEMTPLFAAALAVQAGEVIAQLQGAELIELGPGSGRLAADLLNALDARNRLPQRYRLLEVSADLAARQRDCLRERAPALFSRVDWMDVLPARWRGVMIANEVLDAVPPHLIARQRGTWFERGVAVAGGRLALADRPLAAGALRDAAAAAFPAQGDYVSEINPAAQALVVSLAERCDAGLLLVIDYGFPAAEYYHPQRAGGTLIAHYRHRAVHDPLFLPGLSDLSAHVDFSAIARAGVAGGMTVGGYATQARFLINCGILDALAGCGDPSSAAYLREAAAVQKLLSPAEMGELFKALALLRGIDGELTGFGDGDQSHRL
ncbi:MAG TPA: SAM-dependent methyltransferase [Casimicrobiaceae bacterium]|jgi:SAM-dependent MidA family methyltransferase